MPLNPIYDPIIAEASKRYGVPEQVIRAVTGVESSGRQGAVSPKGASGLMQVMPETYAEIARENGLGPDRFEPRNNIHAGTAYLRKMYDKFGNWGDAFSAYNAGPGRMQQVKEGKATLPQETRDYTPMVTAGLGLTREGVIAELQRRGRPVPEGDVAAPPKLTREGVIAELQRRGRPVPNASVDAAPPAPKGDSSSVSAWGELGRGFSTGIDQVQGALGFGMETLGRKTGWEGLQEYGAEVRRDNAVEAKQTPGRVSRVEDIGSLGDFADWAAYTIGTVGPQVGVSMVGAVLGGITGGPTGAFAGAAAPSFVMNAGEVYDKLLEKGIDPETATNIALAAGVPMAALDAIVPGKVGSRVVGNVAADAGTTLLGRTIKGGGKGMVQESATETGQTAIGIAAQDYAGVAPTYAEAKSELLNAAAAGAISGGGMGAAGGALERQAPAAVTPPPPPPAAGPTPPPVTPGPTPAAPPPPAAAAPPFPGYVPFLDQDGSQIGWQSPDGTTVVSMDARTAETAPPVDLRSELEEVVKSSEPVEDIVQRTDLSRPMDGEVEMPAVDPLTGAEEPGFYHEPTGTWRAVGETPTRELSSSPPTRRLSPEGLAPDQPTTPPEAPADGPAPGFVRMYHGGLTQAQDAPTWFSSDPRYAEDWASQNGRTGAGLLYVDIPENHPLIAPEYPEESIARGFHQNVELPAELARMAQPVIKGTSAGEISPEPIPRAPVEHIVREGNQLPPPPPRPALPAEPFRAPQEESLPENPPVPEGISPSDPTAPINVLYEDQRQAGKVQGAGVEEIAPSPPRPGSVGDTFNEARLNDLAALEAANSATKPEGLSALQTVKRPFPQTVSMVEKDLQNRKTKPNIKAIASMYDLSEEDAAKVLASIAGRGNTVIRQVQASKKERAAQAKGEGKTTAPRYRLTPRSDKTSLINLLASRGGLSPNGDLSAMDLDKVRTPGAGGMLVRKGGMTLDQARELAEEEGFIGSSDDYQTSDIQELLDAIEEEHRGTRVTETRADRHGPERQQMENFARSLGIEFQDDWTDAELLVEIGEADAVRRGDPSLSADVDEVIIQAMLEDMGIFDLSIFSTAEQTDFDIPFPDELSGTQLAQGSEGEVAQAAGRAPEEPSQGPEGQAGPVRQGDSAPEARTGEPDTGTGAGQQKPLPRVERTDQGDQYVFGGEAGQRTSMPTLKGKVPQEPADEGLFAEPKEPEPEQLDIETAIAGKPKESRLGPEFEDAINGPAKDAPDVSEIKAADLAGLDEASIDAVLDAAFGGEKAEIREVDGIIVVKTADGWAAGRYRDVDGETPGWVASPELGQGTTPEEAAEDVQKRRRGADAGQADRAKAANRESAAPAPSHEETKKAKTESRTRLMAALKAVGIKAWINKQDESFGDRSFRIKIGDHPFQMLVGAHYSGNEPLKWRVHDGLNTGGMAAQKTRKTAQASADYATLTKLMEAENGALAGGEAAPIQTPVEKEPAPRRPNVPQAVARANAAVEAGTATDLEKEITDVARDIARRRGDKERLAREAREAMAYWKSAPPDRIALGGIAHSTVMKDKTAFDRDKNMAEIKKGEEKLQKLVARYAPPAPKTQTVKQKVGETTNNQTTKPADTQSAADILKAAGAAGVKGADQALTGLYKLFGGNKLSSGFTFDEDTYKAAKPHFQEAYKQFAQAGRSLLEFAKFINANFGEGAKPYLKRFLMEASSAREASSETFVTAPDGSPDFGEIDAEAATAIGRQAGKIRLRQGDAMTGLTHIEQRHAEDAKGRGYPSVPAMVADITRNYDEIHKGKGRTLILIKRSDEHGAAWVQLEPSENDDFYDIKTATPTRQDFLQGQEPAWKRSARRDATGSNAGVANVARPLQRKGPAGDDNVGVRGAEGNPSVKEEKEDLGDSSNPRPKTDEQSDKLTAQEEQEKEPEGTPAVEPAPDPVPGTDKPVGEQVDGASVLASHGLKATQVTTKNGKVAWEISGNTHSVKDALKGMGASWYGPKKVWTFWNEEDPTDAIAEKLGPKEAPPAAAAKQPERGDGKRPGDDTRSRRKSSSDARLRAVRQREDARADERGDVRDVGAWVEPETQELIRRGLNFGMPEEVVTNQIEDVALIHRAYATGKKLFLLANEAGTGKTFVLGGAIRELRRAGAEHFIYVTLNQDLITQIRRDLEPYGIGNVTFYTYSDLSKNAPAIAENTALIFDETHSIKDPSSARGKSGQKMIAGARFTIFSSATPFENPVQAKYLQATGIFDPVGGHTDWSKMYGASIRKIESFNYKTGQKEVVEVPYWQGGKAEDGIAARTWFMKQGIMTQRAKKLPANMVDSTFRKTDVPKEWLDKYEQVEAAYTEALRQYRTPDGRPVDSKIYSMISMHRINMIKRILEASKVDEAIARAKHHLADGRQVVIFVETKADREVGKFRKTGDSSGPVYSYPEMAQLMQRWEIQKAASKGFNDDPPPFSDAIMAIALAMHNLGVSFTLPSTTDEIITALGKDNVAVYTGAVTGAAASKNKADFLAKKKSVLIATMAKGGTGLSLHDTKGDSPRVQVGLNLPWVASAVDQVSGRIARYGLQSKALIEWLFAGNIPFEQSLAQRVGSRMRDMGALVKGIDLQAASILTEFNLEEETLLPTEGEAAEIEAEEAGREPTRAELLAMAERLERTRRKADDTSGGFFATPFPLAVAMRYISGVFAGDRVLEPSAGHGALVRFLPGNLDVTMVERRQDNVAELNKLLGKKEGHNVVSGDFLEVADGLGEGFDTILMNPPFERLAGIGPQDIAHVRKAYGLLAEGGRLVALMGEGAFFREQKPDVEFRDWLEERGAIVVKLPENTFKNSGTGVNVRMVVIDEGASGGRTDIDLHDVETNSLERLIIRIPVRERDRHGFRASIGPKPDRALPDSVLYEGQERDGWVGLGGGKMGLQTPEFQDARDKVMRAIADMANRLSGGRMPVQIYDMLVGKRSDEGPVFEAFGLAKNVVNGIVLLSLRSDSIAWTLRHESIHFLRNTNLLDGADWRVLEAQAKGWRKRFEIDERYGNLSEEILNEEAVADAYAGWADGKLDAKGPVLRAFQKMRRFFEAVKNLLAGNGFRTANSVFASIERGDVARGVGRGQEETAGDNQSNAAGSDAARFMLPPAQGNLGQQYTAGPATPAPGPRAPGAQVNQGNLFTIRTHLPDKSMVEWLLDSNQSLIDRVKNATSKAAIGVQVDRARQLLQDRYIRLKRVQEIVEGARGSALLESENAYRAEEGFTSKAMEKIFRLNRDHKKPLLQAIHASKLSVAQIEKFLYARHAKERNARIASINPKFAAGEGSGMTDAEADGVMNAFRVMGIIPELEAIAARVDALTSAILDERVAGGLMSQQEALRWRQTYRHYVPLRGMDEILDDGGDPERPRGGQGYNVKGPESQRALGRKSRASNILSNIFMQADEAIIRSEKNAVLLSLLNLVQNAADKTYWEVNKVEIKPFFNKVTGLVEYRATSRLTKEEDERTVRLKVNGQEHRITIHDYRLVAALKNLEGMRVNSILRGLMAINRYLSLMNTGMNPEFLITNAFRDVTAANINMSATDLVGLRKAVMRDYGKALKGAWGGVRGRNDTVWAQHFRDFAADGGRVSFFTLDNLDEHKIKIERDLRRMGPGPWNAAGRVVRSVGALIGDANAAVDNGIRLSTYVNAKRLGMTGAQAASLAKNLTINFNRRGELGPAMNAMYLFFNASVQGTAVMMRALKHRKVRRIVYGIVVLGFMMEMLNAMISPDDDDGEDKYSKIKDFTKSRNLIIMSPSGQAITIPLPYGFNAFFDLGRNFAAYVRGHQGAGTTLGNITTTAIDAFNPIGGTQTLLNFLSPTIIDPFVDYKTNIDFAGRKIVPETPYDPHKPESQKYWANTGPGYRVVAEQINELTGGNEFKSGKIDISPETIDQFVQFAGGAAFGFVTRTFGLLTKWVAGEEVVMNDIPFGRKVVAVQPPGVNRSLFYERAEQIEALASEKKGLGKAGRKDEVDQLKIEHGDMLKLTKAAENTRTMLANIRKAKSGVKADGSLTAEERRKRLEQYDLREKRQLDHFNRLYVEKVLRPQQAERAWVTVN